jgi:tetrahydromethanopterin S-methyltransferase subunit G
MISRFLKHADTALMATHAFLWMAVTIVWVFAWRVESAPMGPPFGFARQFIGRVDVLVSPQIEELSVSLAIRIAKWSGKDLGLIYAVLFGCLILLAGTLQWFLIGRLIQWIASKYGQTSAILFSTGVGCCIALAFISWAMSW